MALTITLDVFSGRPNPVWTVPDGEAQQFDDRIHALTDASNVKASGMGLLGYRGFSVVNSSGATRARVFAGAVDQGSDTPTLVAGNSEIEEWLLSTAPGEVLSGEVRSHVQQAIAGGGPLELVTTRMLKGARCPVCQAADAPVYNPSIWNTPTVQPFNNCYNYANNQITNTFAQPGRATGNPITALSCPGVQPSAVSDGLSPSANFSAPLSPGQGWYVALVIWPGNDYHWYRQDNVGCWSHKPGSTAARNVDNAGNPIADPKTCDRGPYTVFCTYMVTKTTVRIR